jgi:AcrR family transcriptional regulator
MTACKRQEGRWPLAEVGPGRKKTGPAEQRGLRCDFRETILEAARRIIDEQGLQAATTRNISELAGCAEGTIYRHFEDKHELFLELFAGSAPEFLSLVGTLPERAGAGTVRATLTQLVLAALRFYRAVLPFVGGAIVDPELRALQRQRFNTPERGPVHAFAQVDRYVKAERKLGRLTGKGSSQGAASALLGAAFSRAFLDVWIGEDVLGRGQSDNAFAAAVVETLLYGLGPPAGEELEGLGPGTSKDNG